MDSLTINQINTLPQKQYNGKAPKLFVFFVWFSIVTLIVDKIYSYYHNITLQNRSECIVYEYMPKAMFLFYEYMIETFIIVVVGVFFAVIVETKLKNYQGFVPKSSVSAFIFASVLPLCSCGVIPMIDGLKSRLPYRSLIVFVIAAPLLNPYVVALSYSVLGLEFTLYRIAGAFVLALSTGFVMELLMKGKLHDNDLPVVSSCSKKPDSCKVEHENIYDKAFAIIDKIWPYIILAGLLGLAFELLLPVQILDELDFSSPVLGTFIAILAGLPLYLCNGADVLFLNPLIINTELPMGTALGFSFTSTAICASSAVMLVKYIGKKATTYLIVTLFSLTLMLGSILNLFL